MLQLFDDYEDEILLLFTSTIALRANFVVDFFTYYGFSVNHFSIGVIGAFLSVLIPYVVGKKQEKRKKTQAERIMFVISTLILGGVIAMIILPYISNYQGIIGISIGASWQVIWKEYLSKIAIKFLPKPSEIESEDTNKVENSEEDRPPSTNPPR